MAIKQPVVRISSKPPAPPVYRCVSAVCNTNQVTAFRRDNLHVTGVNDYYCRVENRALQHSETRETRRNQALPRLLSTVHVNCAPLLDCNKPYSTVKWFSDSKASNSLFLIVLYAMLRSP